jgi:N-acetylmuramoyl-L-alanine amidase
MRFAFGLLLGVGFAFVGATAPAIAPGNGALRIQGQPYVRLLGWARERGFERGSLKREDAILLTNPNGTRLQFFVDSREARLNGLQVWLLFPLASRNGEPFISQSDLDHTLRPLLTPPRNTDRRKIKTICLDPGHGGKDPGNRAGGRQEKDYVLRLAFELRDQLERAGFKVLLTRSTDKFIELPDRPGLARRRQADLFVSLHFNATESGRNEAKGAEVYALTPAGAPSTNARGEGGGGSTAGNKFNEKNLLLAHEIQKALVHKLEAEDRGVRRARFAVLRDATMPATLIEGGFLSHPVEGGKILYSAYRRKMAQAITEGITRYQRIVER